MRLGLRSLALLILPMASIAHAATLSGTVTRSDTGGPLADARVLVRGTGLSVQTNSEGAYAIPTIPNGHYGLTCSAPGLVGVSTSSVDLTADATRDFNLDPPAVDTLAITGTVTCASVGCAGVLVQARHEGSTVARALSGPGGAYTIAGLAENTYDIRGLALTYLLDEQLGVQATLLAPPVVNLNLVTAGRTYVVTGVVGLADNPLDKSGSTVRVYGQQTTISTQTETGGSYRLEGVPAGLLSFAATHTGYRWHPRIDVLVQGDRSLHFVLGEIDENGSDPTFQVSGTITLDDPDGGDPITLFNTRVSLFAVDGSWTHTASTGAGGAYVIRGAPAGTYQLASAREGWLSTSLDAFALDANRTEDLHLTLDPEYDWGPGETDGELGCSCAASSARQGPLGLILLGLILLRRRR
jgi:MYXO-CTERM domain-containing protein